jgi:uncharacterized membrane protein YgcG
VFCAGYLEINVLRHFCSVYHRDQTALSLDDDTINCLSVTADYVPPFHSIIRVASTASFDWSITHSDEKWKQYGLGGNHMKHDVAPLPTAIRTHPQTVKETMDKRVHQLKDRLSRKGSDGERDRSLFISFMQNLEDLDATTAMSKIRARHELLGLDFDLISSGSAFGSAVVVRGGGPSGGDGGSGGGGGGDGGDGGVGGCGGGSCGECGAVKSGKGIKRKSKAKSSKSTGNRTWSNTHKTES